MYGRHQTEIVLRCYERAREQARAQNTSFTLTEALRDVTMLLMWQNVYM